METNLYSAKSKQMNETLYHIYVNNKCVSHNLIEEDFKREMQHLKGFLELTNLDKSAKIEYETCSALRLGPHEEASF